MSQPPANGPMQLKKGDLLFDEGAPSDAMYVVKSGTISIVKKKMAAWPYLGMFYVATPFKYFKNQLIRWKLC